MPDRKPKPDRPTPHKDKLCKTCRRPIQWQKKYEQDWDIVKFCSEACSGYRSGEQDAALQAAILSLLAERTAGGDKTKTICPSEAAKLVSGDARGKDKATRRDWEADGAGPSRRPPSRCRWQNRHHATWSRGQSRRCKGPHPSAPPLNRVPHLRDGLIVAKVGIRAMREPFSFNPATNARVPHPSRTWRWVGSTHFSHQAFTAALQATFYTLTMDAERIRAFLLKLPHVVETIQWGANLVFWVGDKAIGGKMFALVNLDGDRKAVISYPAGPERYPDLLEIDGLFPAPYMARIHWVAAERWSVFRPAEWEQQLHAAYDLTLAKLPARTRAMLALPKTKQKQLIAERRKLLASRSSKS